MFLSYFYHRASKETHLGCDITSMKADRCVPDGTETPHPLISKDLIVRIGREVGFKMFADLSPEKRRQVDDEDYHYGDVLYYHECELLVCKRCGKPWVYPSVHVQS